MSLPLNPMGSPSLSRQESGRLDGGYRFKLVDGKVAQLEEFDKGSWKRERIEANEVWRFDGTTLTRTETEAGRVSTSTYRDPDRDGVFTRAGRDPLTGLKADGRSPSSSATSSISEDSYRFKLVDGKVTQLEEFDRGRWKAESIKSNETWTFDGTRLIERELNRQGAVVTSYSDPDKDGIFTKMGTVFQPIVSGGPQPI